MPARLSDIIATELDGYKPAPAAYEALDGPAIARLTCDLCGGTLTYRGFYRPARHRRLGPHAWHPVPASYRAFAVCPNCHTAEEF